MDTEAYYPKQLPPKKIKEESFMDQILDINLELGRFDGMLRHNPRKEIVQAFLRAEEVLSAAALEISELSLDEYLEKLLDKGYEADDFNEIRFLIDNYPNENEKVSEKGFSIVFLNEFQQSLLNNRKKRRATQSDLYRERHVWLIKAAEEFDHRHYIHTSEAKINKLMDNLDDFIRESKLHPLITAAIAYGQLTMIHPWRYANGRTTGALIPYLFNFLGITRERSFYLSSAFCRDKDEYYSRLVKLFRENDWSGWINYFLNKVKEQSIAGQKKVEHLLNFYLDIKEKVLDNIFSRETLFYLDVLLSHPVFTAREINQRHGFRHTALNPYIYNMLDAGFLTKDNRKRNINYLFTEIYAIINT